MRISSRMAILRCTTAVLLLNFFISPIWAAQCGVTNASYLYVTSPEDLKNQTQNCDLDATGVYIEPEFVGAFSLNGISNVSSVKLDIYGRWAGKLVFQVASVDLNETTYLNTLDMVHALGLKKVSAPKLEYVYSLEIAGNTTELLDFPVLRNVSSMNLYSNFSRINFPLLRNISWVLSYGPYDFSTGDMPPFQADFPSLETAADISMYGNISSWNTPKLQSIKPSNPDYHVENKSKLKIRHNGEPLALDFPLLSEVETINLVGNLSSVSFPVLQNVTNLEIHPIGYSDLNTNSTPMKINLSALHTVKFLMISGNVTSLSLDSLTDFETLHIRSESPLNCTPLFALYERIRNAKYDPDKYVSGFSCVDSIEQARKDAKNSPKKDGSAKGKIAGIIVGVIAYVCFILAMWYVNYRSKSDYMTGPSTGGITDERAASEPVTDEHELRQRDSMSIKDPAPPYHEATRT